MKIEIINPMFVIGSISKRLDLSMNRYQIEDIIRRALLDKSIIYESIEVIKWRKKNALTD